MWNQGMTIQLDNYLGNELEALYEEIVQNDLISDSTKVKRLKAYKEVLEQFADAIDRALKEKKPLSGVDLYNWYAKMGDVVFGVKNYDYFDAIGYYTSFYDMLSTGDKLEVLGILLLDYISKVLYYIEQTLPELEALTNQS